MVRLFGDHRRDLHARAPQRARGGVADGFGADDDGPYPDPLMVQMDGLLQLPGGEHPGRPCPRHQPCAARTFARAGGEHDRPGGEAFQALGSGGLHGERPGAAGESSRP